MKGLPVYAEVPFRFDQDKARKEIENIEESLFLEIADVWHEGEFNPARYENWMIGSIKDNQEVSHYIVKDGEKIFVPGKTNFSHSADFTWIREEPTSIHSKSVLKEGRLQLFNDLYQRAWDWRKEFQTPYLRSVINELPFEYFQKIRVIRTRGGQSLRVHRDDRPDTTYFDRGFGQMNLNICSGGVTLQFKVGDEIHRAPMTSACHFKSSYLHGVESVKEEVRYTVTVYGKQKEGAYQKALDLGSAVWDPLKNAIT